VSKQYEILTIDTYRLLWTDYEGSSRLLESIRQGVPWWTRELRWFSVGVWLFQQSPNYLFGSELAMFRHAALRGMFVNFVWDTNSEGLQWLGEVIHTSAGVRLVEDICNGSISLLKTFFGERRLVQLSSLRYQSSTSTLKLASRRSLSNFRSALSRVPAGDWTRKSRSQSRA
jgi:hypothetical protein